MMRESTSKTVEMLSGMWGCGFPMADFDCLETIGEIVDAYKDKAVSAESCMEEISLMVQTRREKLGKQFADMSKAVDVACDMVDEVLKDG